MKVNFLYSLFEILGERLYGSELAGKLTLEGAEKIPREPFVVVRELIEVSDLMTSLVANLIF